MTENYKELAKHLIPIAEESFPLYWTDLQLKENMWFFDEPKVEKCILDFKVNCTPAEQYATTFFLKLFTLLETHAGSEYWGGRFKTIFDGFEFHTMGSTFSMVELAVHTRFYKRLNELLNLDNIDFFTSYKDTQILVDKLNFIGSVIDDPSDYVSLAGFSMVEGAMLFKDFAFFKHFQANGKNKLNEPVRGINFSVRDEDIHSKAGAQCYRYKVQKDGLSQAIIESDIQPKIIELAKAILDFESASVKLGFNNQKIDGITEDNLITFTKSRLNICLEQLNIDFRFEVIDCNVSKWFYKGTKNYQANDHFAGIGREYVRSWNEEGFSWDTDFTASN